MMLVRCIKPSGYLILDKIYEVELVETCGHCGQVYFEITGVPKMQVEKGWTCGRCNHIMPWKVSSSAYFHERFQPLGGDNLGVTEKESNELYLTKEKELEHTRR